MDATVVYNNLNDTPKVTSFGRLPDVLIFQLKVSMIVVIHADDVLTEDTI